MQKKRIESLLFILFLISFLYYIFWLGYCMMLYRNGADPGWAAPALGDGTIVYGWEAFGIGTGTFLFFTCTYGWFVPLYQLIYAIVRFIRRKKQKRNAA